MLGRFLDDSYADAVRRDVTTATLARLGANACYRYSAPFLATIAAGLGTELSTLGIVIAITELTGLLAPLVGRRVDRSRHGTTMVAGLVGMLVGALVAAASPGVLTLGAGLVLVAISKIAFDVALGAWIASEVPYERRGRVVGLVETSWALGLLVGVSTMGLVTAISSWRWGYVTGAAMVAAAALAIAVRLRGERQHVAGDDASATTNAGAGTSDAPGLDRRGRLVMLAMFGLMSGAQALFVTLGAWLQDAFGFDPGALAATTVGLGALELIASSTSAARTDRWGKERSVIFGAGLMIPAGLTLAVLDDHLVPGVLALGLFIALFEFSIVSSLSLATQLVPSSPARGLSSVIAAGTLGRALTAAPSTWLYEHRGIWASALLGAACAAITVVAMSAAWAQASDP